VLKSVRKNEYLLAFDDYPIEPTNGFIAIGRIGFILNDKNEAGRQYLGFI
jgi:hypothetical protein